MPDPPPSTPPRAVLATAPLFVPGNLPDRFAKAATSGSDLVIIDLEDAVPSDQKIAARDAAISALGEGGFSAAVRINAASEGTADAAALSRHDFIRQHLLAVVIPKAESPDQIAEVAAILPGVPLIPLVESAVGLSVIDALAHAPGVCRLAFGALDFGVDVGSTSPIMLDHARCTIVIASRAAGLAAALDSPVPEFRDVDVVRVGARSARDLGFGGQLCIHPGQIPHVFDAFLPSDEEVASARRVIAAGIDGAGEVDSAMVDRPVILRAQKILSTQDPLRATMT
ncbi:HpcH/HpaI aldolase/citrate lyase family protein [Microbacterium sp. A588]